MDRTEHERDLTATEQWFRDLLGKLLGLGVGGFVLISGWLLSNDSVLSFHHAADAEKREAALFLCLSLPIAWLLWYGALLHTHSRCPAHPTVITRRLLHLYCATMGVALLILAALAAEGHAMIARNIL